MPPANPLSIYSSTAVSTIVAIAHFGLSRAAAQFADVFEDFGAELPMLTRLVTNDSLYYWVVPLGIALCFVAHHQGYLTRSQTLFISSAATIASIILCVVGLYLPIFQLGSVVNS